MLAFLRQMLASALALGLLAACGGGPSNDPPLFYEAVVEADYGSPRIYLYQYTVQGSSRRAEAIWVSPLEGTPPPPPPLPSFELAPANAGPQGIRPLLDRLSAELGSRSITKSQVPVSVLGLDAMRAVRDRSPQAAAAIYASVRQSVIDAGYASRYAATLAAPAQGAFLWAAVNDLYGNLAPGRTTNGIIDVGGYSAQVVYAVPSPSTVVPPPFAVTVRGESYQVFSISYQGLGVNEARRQMIFGGESGSGTALNNCYPNNAARVSPVPFDAGLGGLTIASGNYVFETCSALYETIVRARGVSRTVAVPGFGSTPFVIPDSLGIGLSSSVSPTDIVTRLNALCEGPDAWSLRLRPYAGESVVAQNTCANGTFLHTFLFGPNGVNAAASNVGFIRQVDGITPRVSRGFVLLDGTLGGLGTVWAL